LPYPQLGVAELQPPAGRTTCGTNINLENLYMACPGSTIKDVIFAAYGTPGGRCGAFTRGKCDAPQAVDVVKKYCVGQSACSIPITTEAFGDPCFGTVKWLSVELLCEPALNKTSWDFSLIDPMMEDLMEATEGKSTIINFSTMPEWMWNTNAPVLYPADPNQVTWGYTQGNVARDSTFQEIGDYYERLVSWYTKGMFTDEFGQVHKNGHMFNIPMWEVFNEIDSEHAMTPQYYTQIYDVVVKSIQKVQPNMEFVGLALAGVGSNWVQYFLNSSNHAPGIPLHWISYHFYASPGSRTDPNGYEIFFPQSDGFFGRVVEIEKIRKALSPSTKVDLDELGVILPGDNDQSPAPIPDIYWNAAGAMFAYVFGNLLPLGIDVLGESQLIGHPLQYPSVSLTHYPDGVPNARFWVLYLLHEQFHVGDNVHAATSDDKNVFAAAYGTPAGKRILIINKTNKAQSAVVTGLTKAQLFYVDETTGNNAPGTLNITAPTISLKPFSVVVVALP